MFIDFQFGNFRSFRDPQSFSMLAAPKRKNDAGLDEANVVLQNGLRFLTAKAVFGKNAGGKSNLCMAIGAFRRMVIRSVAEEDVPMRIWQDRFLLSTENENEPVFFQYTFLYNRKIFRYGFRIIRNKVDLEWLFCKDDDGGEITYFLREGNAVEIPVNSALSGLRSKLPRLHDGEDEIFRTDALFLTAAALDGNRLAKGIRQLISKINVIDGVNDQQARLYGYFKLDKQAPEEKNALVRLIKNMDTGIEGLFMSEAPEASRDADGTAKNDPLTMPGERQRQLYSVHNTYNRNNQPMAFVSVPFEDWESEGTKKLLALGAFMLDTLKLGGVLVVDEFDARLHPNLALHLIQKFQHKETNPLNAQIIFATHDTGFMRRAQLRRDQIVIVEKDRAEASSLRTLIEYKGVRKDASYEKEYLEGKYAGIPYLEEDLKD